MTAASLQRVSTLFFYALATAVQANALPTKLNMVIFSQSPSEPAPQTLTIEQANSDSSMQMVIFNQDAPAPVQEAVTSPVAATSQAEPSQETKSVADDFAIQYYLDAGYRRDDLNWNIAAPSGTPNIMSELQWKKIESTLLNTGINITYADHWEMAGKLAYGKVISGRNQDSDYIYDNRQGEFSRSNNRADSGASIDLSGSLGYHLHIGDLHSAPQLRLTPKIGYAYHSQQFNNTHGVQTVSDNELAKKVGIQMPPLGNFNAVLNSTYDATWYGAWGGMSTQLLLSKRLALQGSLAYHLVNYDGTGNWNLRSDFQHPKSFTHSAEGHGILASASARYLLTPEWGVRLSADYQNFKATSKGIDTTFGSDGSSGETKLNQVNWNSYGFNLGLEYNF